MISVACIQHVAFEGPGAIEIWAGERGLDFTVYRSDLGELPLIHQVDMLVILGGSMSVHDEARFPWLVPEKKLIAQALSSNITVIGICLGAQLIAQCLGADVVPAPQKEFGVFGLTHCAPEGYNAPLLRTIPPTFNALHWHGEMFTIPRGAIPFARSEGCPNQAFIYENRVVAMQYHLEATEKSVALLMENCGEDLAWEGEWVQEPEVILKKVAGGTKKIRGQLYVILDSLMARILTR